MTDDEAEELLRALAEVCLAGREPTRGEVARQLFLTSNGLRTRHRRAGMTWHRYLDQARRRFEPPVNPCAAGLGWDHCCMARLVLTLTPAMAEQLRDLARHEMRHPRDEAAVLLRDALDRRRLPRRLPVRATEDAA